jgi:hypothetical protein
MWKNKKLIIVAAICVLLLIATIFLFQPQKYPKNTHVNKTKELKLDFLKEEITILISRDEVVVEGIYYFQSNLRTNVSFYYPFPVDSLHDYPYEISIEELDTGNVSFKRINKGIIFNLYFDANETKVVSISYAQKIKANNAKYILTTTKAWKKGLKEAEFCIIVPKTLKNISISYQPDEIHEEGNETRYIIRKEDFMPEKDINISWA